MLPLLFDDPSELGGYRLLARLGSGGMGVVYLARSAGGAMVAVKTAHAAVAADEAFRARFRLEIDAARVIGAVHGARVVDADPLAVTPWLATEYVVGPSLGEAVARSGPLPEGTVRALGAALCAGLGLLHRSEVVHRDLKPSNVLVTAFGPKLIDFGIARAAGDERLTHAGGAVGTPAFMSPEQATGQEHTAAGDVFALAGVLAFAACGRGPFGDGQPADLLYRVRYSEPDLSALPPSLAGVLGEALAKNPFARPTTEQLAARLHDGSGQFADHLPAAVLADIARRAVAVWKPLPPRLPAPADAGADARAGAEPASAGPGADSGGVSRRRLLIGGGAVVGAAGAGTALWAWSGGGAGSPQASAADAPQDEEVTDRSWLWQKAVTEAHATEAPTVPMPVGELVTMVVGTGLGAVDLDSGEIRWASEDKERPWQVTADGEERLFRLVLPKEADGNEDKAGGYPLVVAPVDLSLGEAGDAVARLREYNGVLVETQLLCVADNVLYLVAGSGPYAWNGFAAGQSWAVVAVDLTKGTQRWAAPLPARPKDHKRLHVLAAAVAGERLVTVHERNDGSVRAVARDLATGRTVWQEALDVEDPARARSKLAADDTHLYLGWGPLRALRLSDGRQAWQVKPAKGKAFGPPSVREGVVYAVEDDRGVVAVDAGTGTKRWQENSIVATVDSVLTHRPLIGDQHVYSRAPGGLRAVSMSTHATTTVLRSGADRFTEHRAASLILALGDTHVAAYPLD